MQPLAKVKVLSLIESLTNFEISFGQSPVGDLMIKISEDRFYGNSVSRNVDSEPFVED